MNEIEIKFNVQSPQKKNTAIDIMVSSGEEENLLYKFNIGNMSVWTTLKEFDKCNSVTWTPAEDGEYQILIQAKKEDSARAFDYLSRATYVIGEKTEEIIKAININKNEFKLGDKLEANVITYKEKGLLYKYYMKVNDSWEIIKDYSPENTLNVTVNEIGEGELLVQVKETVSLNNFDESKIVKFNVHNMKPLEIKDFKCLTEDSMVINKEIIFQVDATVEDTKTTLYKFLKIDGNGKVRCIQDYSTKRIVSFVETVSGDYRLLCMAKDMYSKNEYDDRAIINYKIKRYKPIKIKKLTTDLVSPQICGRDIVIKALAEGGNELLYRFLIDGNQGEDSGYIRDNSYIWHTQREGVYKITVMIKDKSFNKEAYEVRDTFEYVIDRDMLVPLKIKEIRLNKDREYLKGETVNITVKTQGGIESVYSFILYNEEKEKISEIDYSESEEISLTPENAGEYELEIRVKDKYSLKEYDCNTTIFFKVKEFIPANIDYILRDLKEYYRINDEIALEVVTENTSEVFLKYKMYINDHFVEETEYINSKKYNIKPRCSGKYRIEILAKNKKSTNEYDCKKELSLYVHEAMPITDTKIKCDSVKAYINESINFMVECNGGKDICYEFYLMERGEWKRVQRYSKKKFYSFIPFSKGNYKILALVKNSYKKVAYEDYSIYSFDVEVKNS